MAIVVIAALFVFSLALAVAGAGALMWSVLSIMELMQRDRTTRAGSRTMQERPLAERLAA